jgi:Holliday junction resolvase RusA-like endonuclease
VGSSALALAWGQRTRSSAYRLTVQTDPKGKKNTHKPFVNSATGKLFIGNDKLTKAHQKAVASVLRYQWRKRPALRCLVAVEIVYYRSERRGDLSNFDSMYHDCLQEAGVLHNDAQIVLQFAGVFKDRRRPRIEILLWEMPDDYDDEVPASRPQRGRPARARLP